MPRATLDAVVPVDHQDELYGMQYRFALKLGGVDAEPPLVDAGTLLDYQLVQAVVAHQTGALMRLATVESIDDPAARRTAWIAALRPLLAGVDGPNLPY